MEKEHTLNVADTTRTSSSQVGSFRATKHEAFESAFRELC